MRSPCLTLMLLYILPGAYGVRVPQCFVNGKLENVTENEICCNGVIAPKAPDNSKDCCRGRDPNGNQFYNKTQSICCNGTVEARWVPPHGSSSRTEMACCNKDRVFNKAAQLCCGDKLHNLSDGLKCCGHDVFDARVKACCFGNLSKIAFLDPTNPRELNLRDIACCGRTGYDSRTHKCCLGPRLSVVIPKHKHRQCCGSGSFDTRTQICRDGKAVCKNGPADACCGTTSINSSTQGCCDGKPFYSRTHYCCEGSPSQPLRIGLKCCGGREMNDNQLCCDDDEPVDKIFPEDDKCCQINYKNGVSTYIPYDSRVKDCTDIGIVARLSFQSLRVLFRKLLK